MESEKGQPWKPDDVLKILVNPIYTGMGPYPSIITEEVWIQANIKAIKELGAEVYLHALLDVLHESFPRE